MNGLGVHEVIIESPEHVESMALLSEKQLEAVLLAYRDRMLQFHADSRWRYILIYKNQGAEAGATLPHVHSQLVVLPSIPRAALEELDGANRFYDATGRCIYCEMIRKETDERKRIVAAHECFVVLCPYAARFPFEVWILPREHSPCFEKGLPDNYIELARVLRETLIRLNRQLDDPSFNYIIHSNPLGEPNNQFYHWHMEIMPRLTQIAGFEWGSGSYINPVAPEDAARLLRQITL
jgi:UDPglucose--hexose-1-phosphate uridylyltransferase